MGFGTLKANRGWGVVCAALALSACERANTSVTSNKRDCAPDSLTLQDASSSLLGSARVFEPDPMSASGNPRLSPQSLTLDRYATATKLENLDGYGVLAGANVDVRNGEQCDGWYGAYSSKHGFEYSYGDTRFSEAMTYAWSDRYLAWLAKQGPDNRGYRLASGSLPILARCPEKDQAYFSYDPKSGFEFVCIGLSASTPGASLSDDAQVFVHEIQHALTTHAYPYSDGLGRFRYDEAGALNEALSDFMALMFTESSMPAGWDLRQFSRWALGQFWVPTSQTDHSRGANLCPAYDPRYPNCAGGVALSADQNNLTFNYPDGMGWPYGQNYVGPGYLRSAFLNPLSSQHEIHNNAIVATGAMWDVYQALLARHPTETATVKQWMVGLVQEAVARLPIPTAANLSPVTYRGFAAQVVFVAGALLHLSTQDQAAITSALTARGLFGGALTDATWLGVGPGATDSVGTIQSPGLRVEDSTVKLTSWARNLGSPVTPNQGTGTTSNGRVNAGETVALWLDLLNRGESSVGGLLVDVTIQGTGVTFVDGRASSKSTFDPLNTGRISATRAQVIYNKVYGSRAVTALASTRPSYHVPTGNSFLKTDALIGASPAVALWIKADSSIAPGTVINLSVTVTPSNGVASSAVFPLKVW